MQYIALSQLNLI